VDVGAAGELDDDADDDAAGPAAVGVEPDPEQPASGSNRPAATTADAARRVDVRFIGVIGSFPEAAAAGLTTQLMTETAPTH
jgi:hypothetical protein